MSNFSEFQEAFEAFYQEGIYDFMWDMELTEPKNHLKAELVENLDSENYDSYGSEDSDLKRVYKFPDFGGIFVSFEGNRSSYQGEEWYEYKEVEQKEKVIKYWE